MENAKQGGTHHIVDVNSVNDTIQVDLISGFAQRVDFGVAGFGEIIIDEPQPLGENKGPSPTRVLAAALASCLGASLLFCLRKARVDVTAMHTTASVKLKRNEQGRLRVESIDVHLEPTVVREQHSQMTRCLEVFEDYCIVTASVRPNIAVNVSVRVVEPSAVEPAGTEPSATSTADDAPITNTPATDSLNS